MVAFQEVHKEAKLKFVRDFFVCLLLFFFAFPSYISGVHHFWWDFCVCDRVFNPTIHIPSSWMVRAGCVFVAGIHPSRTWTSGSFESVQWNACVHRLDLGLYSHPKEFFGEWSLNPCELQGKNPQRRIEPAPLWTASPNTANWAIPAPQVCEWYAEHLFSSQRAIIMKRVMPLLRLLLVVVWAASCLATDGGNDNHHHHYLNTFAVQVDGGLTEAQSVAEELGFSVDREVLMHWSRCR